MKLSIVIPNYNGVHLLEKNLPRLISNVQTHKHAISEIIISDDASDDKSVSWVQSFAKRKKDVTIVVVEAKKNKGFSSTVNHGVSRARGNIVILLNTDVYPKGDFIDASLPHFNNPKLFGVGFLDESVEGSTIVKRGRGIGWWEKGFYRHRKGDIDKSDTAWLSGGSCMLRKDVFDELSGFDEDYNPFYWEDIDLSYRAQKAGYALVFENKSIVVHEHDKGAIKSKYSEQEIKQIAYRNQFLFVWKNATAAQLVSHIVWLPVYLVRAIMRGDTALVVGILEATRVMLKN